MFKRGFTLVELIVIVGIVTVISSVILAGSARFDNSILLTNLSYEVALSIREAQFSGLYVVEFKFGGGSEFDTGYGVNFYKTNVGGSSNTTDYILFADIIPSGSAIGDQVYSGDSSGGAEFVKKYSAKKGNYIELFCGINAISSAEQCSDVAGGLTYLNISFYRPNPDANFKSNTGVVYKAAKIYLKSAQGNRRAIRVESSGQISVCSVITC